LSRLNDSATDPIRTNVESPIQTSLSNRPATGQPDLGGRAADPASLSQDRAQDRASEVAPASMAKSLKRKRQVTKAERIRCALSGLALLVGTASCVPLATSERPIQPLIEAAILPGSPVATALAAADQATPPLEPMVLQPVTPLDAEAINAAIPIAAGPNPRPASVVFRAQSGWDQQRSLQCLAEAVYYEARSEGEDGQRAVAQVVLNRVRHPAFPKSVCGVVYQGPLRAGGGCQFTFTCDGSLANQPSGPAWDRARRIAGEALAGAVYAPVGYATHYHTQQVVPVWAYRLLKSAVIGAHSFYRLPGSWGDPGAFRAAYAGHEPAPSVLLASRPEPEPSLPAPTLRGGKLVLSAQPMLTATAGPQLRIARADNDRLPDSGVREEFRTSGQWLPQPGEAATR
jgi:spore germination cell wall hydrolase CwlJ-like protein